MARYGFPILFDLFVWWFSTGLIIYLDGLPRRTFRWSMLGATALLAASLYGLALSADDTSVRGAYIAFTCGMLAWGWQEISFYMGFVTGPRTEPCAEGCAGWRHFGHAIQTSLYHELAIIAAACMVVGLTWHAPNQIGTWTFMVLWWMHQSAKLNVFLGVRNLNEEFLPEHLTFLRSFLKKKPMNLLFPVSVTVSTVIAVLLVRQAMAPGAGAFQAAGFTFLATLMILAILEHWFLVVPLPAAALWSWGLRSRKAVQAFDVEIVAGFLGAGKTTFLRRRLAEADPAQRTVVLVNDFSAMDVDGALLRERSANGAEVVELPNGCICCSLRQDLGNQLKAVVARFAPDRVLIEPSGVADVAALLGVINQPELRPLVRGLRVFAMIDASAFLADFARLAQYFEAQARLADVLIVNKADLASAAEMAAVTETIRAINPDARIIPARFGVVPAAVLAAKTPPPEPAPAHHDHAHHEHAHHDHAHHDHDHHHDAGSGHEVALGFASWSTALEGDCDPERLLALLDAIAGGAYGGVVRVKGIARVGDGWLRFDVAGGRPAIAAFAPQREEPARVVAIGHGLDEAGLQLGFTACHATASALV